MNQEEYSYSLELQNYIEKEAGNVSQFWKDCQDRERIKQINEFVQEQNQAINGKLLNQLQLFQMYFDEQTRHMIFTLLKLKIKNLRQLDYYVLKELEDSIFRQNKIEFNHSLVSTQLNKLDLTPVYLSLNSNLFSLYNPGEYLSIIEISNQIYAISDVSTDYILEVFNKSSLLSVISNYQGSNHKLIVDSSIATIQLFQELSRIRIAAIGQLNLRQSLLSLQDIARLQLICYDQISINFYHQDLILTYFIDNNQLIGIITNYIQDSQYPECYHTYQKYNQNILNKQKLIKSQLKYSKNQIQLIQIFIQLICINAKTLKSQSLFKFKISLIDLLKQKLNLKTRATIPSQNHQIISGNIKLKCTECGQLTNCICQNCTQLLDTKIGLCFNDKLKCITNHIGQGQITQKDMQKSIQKAVGKRKGIACTWARLKIIKQNKEKLENEKESITSDIQKYQDAILLLIETLNNMNFSNQRVKQKVKILRDLILEQNQQDQLSDIKSQNESQIDLGFTFNSDSDSIQY